MSRSVTIVATGTANLASVRTAFMRLGVDSRLAASADDVDRADRVVLPGVGTFGAAMTEIDRQGLRESLRTRIDDGRPTLAICVGMQLLSGASEESPYETGLGVSSETVRRLPDELRVPQLGWNQVEAGDNCRLITDGWAYFANSFSLRSAPPSWSTATTDYGETFVSALEYGDVLACQFHPELSGRWGAALLDRWLTSTGGAV